MTAVTGNPSEFSLSSVNDSTGWLSAAGIVDDVGFAITGIFVGSIALQISSESDFVKTRFTTVATYTIPTGSLALPRIAAPWFRLIMTAYTSGTAYVGISKPNSAGRDSVPVGVTSQLHSSGPGVDYFITPSGDKA